MKMETPWYDQIVIPALLRHARSAYGGAMRSALDAAGFDDIPGNGLYVIGGLALGGKGVPIGQLVRDLRVSKQSAGQLVDALVTRGYLERAPDPGDRRQLIVTLTPRGQAAAEIQGAAREAVDSALVARVGEETVRAMRHGLGALIMIAHEAEEAQ